MHLPWQSKQLTQTMKVGKHKHVWCAIFHEDCKASVEDVKGLGLKGINAIIYQSYI